MRLFVVYCLWLVVSGLCFGYCLIDVCCLLFVVRGLWFVVYCSPCVVRCCYLLDVVLCALLVVCCSLYRVCGLLLFVVCCMFVVC